MTLNRLTSCPCCTQVLDRTMKVSGLRMRVGDFSICAYCVNVLRVVDIDPIAYEPATEEVLARLPTAFLEQLRLAQRVLREERPK